MEAQHLTQEALAAKLGVRHPTVGDWLRGKHPPEPRSLTKLAELSGEDPIVLFRMVGYLPAEVTGEGKIVRPAVARIVRKLENLDDLLIELVDRQITSVLVPYFERFAEREQERHKHDDSKRVESGDISKHSGGVNSDTR